jgi:hypothetical protein
MDEAVEQIARWEGVTLTSVVERFLRRGITEYPLPLGEYQTKVQPESQQEDLR